MPSWRTTLLVGLTLAASCLAHAKQLAVVTDNGTSTSNVTSAELIKIFDLRSRTWPDGKPVAMIVMRDPSSTEMELVLGKLLNMSSQQAQAFIQAHKAAIVVAASDEAVLRFVAANHGAIGIVDLYSLTKDVTVVKIDGKLPVEQGYLLRGN